MAYTLPRPMSADSVASSPGFARHVRENAPFVCGRAIEPGSHAQQPGDAGRQVEQDGSAAHGIEVGWRRRRQAATSHSASRTARGFSDGIGKCALARVHDLQHSRIRGRGLLCRRRPQAGDRPLLDRPVEQPGEQAERDRDPPHRVIGLGRVVQPPGEPHAEERADLVREEHEAEQHRHPGRAEERSRPGPTSAAPSTARSKPSSTLSADHRRRRHRQEQQAEESERRGRNR